MSYGANDYIEAGRGIMINCAYVSLPFDTVNNDDFKNNLISYGIPLDSPGFTSVFIGDPVFSHFILSGTLTTRIDVSTLVAAIQAAWDATVAAYTLPMGGLIVDGVSDSVGQVASDVATAAAPVVSSVLSFVELLTIGIVVVGSIILIDKIKEL